MSRTHKALVLGLALSAAAVSACHDAGKPLGSRASAQSAARTNLPDWSGLWDIEATKPDSTGGFEHSVAEVTAGMRQWGPPPYADTIRPKVEKFEASMAKQIKNTQENGPSGIPPGGPGATGAFGFPLIMLASPLMFEVLPTPKETVLVFSGREIRHVYTDGRAHPAKEDLWPTYWGDSVGHWEGQTLVIDTIAVQSGIIPPEMPMIPVVSMGGKDTTGEIIGILSRQAHFVERIRMVDGHLEDQMTITDPVMLSAPWRVSRTYERVTTINRMIHEDGGAVNRNPVVNGKLTVAPPPPAPPPPPPDMAPLLAVLAKAAG